MDKGRKLRRYNRKDYSQVVDFPVEIVGRDGVVRRYSFEESVRLYQRRIASAGLRYQDGDIVCAEVQHCQLRIDQLRRSYFTRHGWSGLRDQGIAGVIDGPLAGEVAAFLRRALAPPSPESLVIRKLSGFEGGAVLHIHDGEEGGGMLLYVRRFPEPGTCPPREEFFEQLKVLRAVRGCGSGVEVLMGFHHTADCGLVLTTQAGDPRADRPVPDAGEDDADWDPDDVDPMREGMAALRQGDLAGALRHLVCAYERDHFRRSAYVGAVVVADQLGEWPAEETAALMGSRYFRQDGVLLYHLALARLRLARPAGALDAIDELASGDQETDPVRLLLALANLTSGRPRAAARALEQISPSPDPDQVQALRALRMLMLSGRLLRGAGAILALAGLTAGISMPALGLTLVALGAGLWPFAGQFQSRQAQRLLSGAAGLRLSNPAALQRPLTQLAPADEG